MASVSMMDIVVVCVVAVGEVVASGSPAAPMDGGQRSRSEAAWAALPEASWTARVLDVRNCEILR